MILPQIGSICRLHGSKRGAVDLLVGDTREAFQAETSQELERVLASKNLSLLFGLTRHIYVPRQVREPIQKAKIADELTKTREQEQLTAKAQADLTEAKAKVTLEEKRTQGRDREARRPGRRPRGRRRPRRSRRPPRSSGPRSTPRPPRSRPRRPRSWARPTAKKTELTRQAEADRFRQYVKALGGPDAYNKYVFAEGLSPTSGSASSTPAPAPSGPT